MRHRKADKKLNRSYSLRKALLRDIARSVILYQSIKTTEAKAKEAKKVVDKLISLGKKQDLHSRRHAFKILYDHRIVKTLFDEIAPRFSKTPGGYTRVLSWTNRKGDNAKMAILELTVKVTREKTKTPTKEIKEEGVKQKTRDDAKNKISPKKEKPKEEPKEQLKEKQTDVPVKKPLEDKKEKQEKKPPKKFLGNLKKIFKKDTDLS